MESTPFFSKETYCQRRTQLASQLPNTTILLLGNDENSINFKDNWNVFRQDSSFLYYTGISLAGLALIINTVTGEEILFGNELTIDEIIWTGLQPTLKELAESAGIQKVLPTHQITNYLVDNVAYLPPYRPEHSIKLHTWLGKNIFEIENFASVPLIKAIVMQRSRKSAEEITQLELVSTVTSRMHKSIILGAKEGMTEHEIVAIGQNFLWENYANNSFQPIATINGNVLHNHYYGNVFTEGKILLYDSGAELRNGYCGDMTRTIPVKTFDTRQQEIYQIVHNAYSKAVSLLSPNITYKEVHLAACVSLVEGLIEFGLMKGNAEEAVAHNAHTMFFQCGLGHMIGLDVHDMENLGEQYVGYTDDLPKSTEFGLKSLRLGKKLEKDFVITVEPGIYIIPDLIDMWKATNKHQTFINYDLLESYKDFGGIRLEDTYAITENGNRLLGEPLSIHYKDIEAMRSYL
jgi:Xaa-Pro aminopeptidase